MKIPPAASIQEGLETLRRLLRLPVARQELAELREAGIDIAWAGPDPVVPPPLPGLTPFECGYLLGLETARAMLQQMPAEEGRSL